MPFKLWRDDRVVGFGLLQQVSRAGAPVMQGAEFYVCPEARRLGIGRRAVHELWSHFPGAWELEVQAQNAPARAFWRRC